MSSELLRTFQKSEELASLFQKSKEQYPPLIQKDSLAFPNYPFCTLGVLTAEADWGKQKGIAFVVEDNYLLTCASNCYSHQHGMIPSITFTINSNRMHGYDTYKIDKILIPQQYKKQSESKNQYNYALLYIEGQQKLKDKYGSLKIVFKETYKAAQRYFQCAIKDHNRLQMIAQHSINSKEITCSIDGLPRFAWSITYAQIDGLIFRQDANSKAGLVKFDKEMGKQLAQWVSDQKGSLRLNNISGQDLDMICFKDTAAKPSGSIMMARCKLRDNQISQILKQLPFASIDRLIVYQNSVVLQLEFLKMEQFSNIQQLTISNCNIGPGGFKKIVDVSLQSLRRLDLTGNKLSHKSCQYLSTGNWPYLQIYILISCNIDTTRLQIIISGNFQNLAFLIQNNFGQEVSQVLENTDFQRICLLNFAENNIDLSLSFLKVPIWRHLTSLSLSNSRIGNSGCKMIKQAALTLRNLELDQCRIEDVGAKWLCKANTSSLISLSLNSNKISDQGCIYLVKANFPCLQYFYLKDVNISGIGLRILVKATWKQSIFSQMYFYNLNLARMNQEHLETSFQGKAEQDSQDLNGMCEWF